MLALGWLLAFIAALVVVMILPAVAWFEVRRRYAGKRKITCPETHDPATIELDATAAANARFRGTVTPQVATCSRWPMREGCAEDCVPEALSQNKADSFSLNHLGVLLAGLAGSAVGDLLRCSPMARDWMAANGFPEVEFWRRIAFRAPAIFDLAAMIVVAYLITWIMRHARVSGVAGGLEVAALLWLAVVGLAVPEVVFFFPVKIFAMNALLKLITLLLQGVLIGLLVLPHAKHEAETAKAH